MLQRLIYKEPKPLKPFAKDQFLFSKEGKLRGYFIKLCEEIHIDPNDLYPKTVEDFAATDITPNIQVHRYNNYENRRRAKIEALKQIAKHRYGSSKNNDLKSLTKGSVLITNLEILAQAAKDESKVNNNRTIGAPGRKSLAMDTQDTPRRMSYGDELIKAAIDNVTPHGIGNKGSTGPFKRGSAFDDDLGKGFSLGPPRRKKSSYGREEELMVRKKTSSIGRELDDMKKNKFGGKDSKPATLVDLDMPKHEKSKFMETRNSDDSDDDNASVAAEMEDQFQHYLVMKAVEKERIRNAPKAVDKIDEEYREKARLKYLEKQKKFQESIKKKEKDKQNKLSKKEEELKIREERIQYLRNEDMQKRKEINKSLLKRMTNAEKKRQENEETKQNKVNENNSSMMEKSMYASAKKWDTEQESPTASLESIERRLAQSFRNRERIQLEKLMQLSKHAYDVEEKYNKVRQREGMDHQYLLHKTVSKLADRTKSTSPKGGKGKDKKKEDSYREDYLAKIEWKRAEDEQKEKEAIKEFKQREKERIAKVTKKKTELKAYIRERQEIIKQKNDNVKENLTICREAEEKKNSSRMYAYTDKYSRIQDLRKTRFQQIVKKESYYLNCLERA